MSKQNSLKKVILLGRKPGATKALRWLLHAGIEVPIVIAQKNEPYAETLHEAAKDLKITVYDDDAPLYRMIELKDPRVRDTDLVLSYLYWRRIKKPLIRLPERGTVNFHPAPLPDYKGRAGYNTAILDRRDWFGATAHFINSEKLDSGPIIRVRKFKIDPESVNAHSLERVTQEHLFRLFEDTMRLFMTRGRMPTKKNSGGLYLTSKQLERMKNIDPSKDTSEEIERKIRAFFFPPYAGAQLIIKGRSFTLIDERVLEYMADFLKRV